MLCFQNILISCEVQFTWRQFEIIKMTFFSFYNADMMYVSNLPCKIPCIFGRVYIAWITRKWNSPTNIFFAKTFLRLLNKLWFNLPKEWRQTFQECFFQCLLLYFNVRNSKCAKELPLKYWGQHVMNSCMLKKILVIPRHFWWVYILKEEDRTRLDLINLFTTVPRFLLLVLLLNAVLS